MAEHDAVDVVVIGAGLAGLTCALRLCEAGRTVRVIEAGDAVGGRVRTDRQDGFLLDRGFQVFLTSYPEAHRWLDYQALGLSSFRAGALVRYGGRFHRFVDPWRSPRDLLAVTLSPVASWMDKLKVARLRHQVCRGSLEALYQRPEQTTAQALRDAGFSDRIVERFFRPFLGGVFLDRELSTSSRMFEFVFRMFSLGERHAAPRWHASDSATTRCAAAQRHDPVESSGDRAGDRRRPDVARAKPCRRGRWWWRPRRRPLSSCCPIRRSPTGIRVSPACISRPTGLRSKSPCWCSMARGRVRSITCACPARWRRPTRRPVRRWFP